MGASLDWDELPIARKSLLPGRGFFEQGDGEPAVSADDLARADVVVVADPDADGLTASALVEVVHGDIVLLPTEPRSLEWNLETVADAIDEPTSVYILDLSPESLDAIEKSLEAIAAAADRVAWYDHHQWDADIIDGVEAMGVDLAIGDSDEVATADVALSELGLEGDGWDDLVAVVRDHDLWLREDPRSDDLADFAHWSDPAAFIETIIEHGADLPAPVMDDIEARRREKDALIEAAVARAEYREVGGYTVGIAYGRCSQNEVAEAMRQSGADTAVVIKPSGGISLRGTETFQRCHKVAEQLGGGGHPKAAGCKPDIYHDMLDYAHHWTTHGATARHAILRAFRQVLRDES